jgi:hypothetical protein
MHNLQYGILSLQGEEDVNPELILEAEQSISEWRGRRPNPQAK